MRFDSIPLMGVASRLLCQITPTPPHPLPASLFSCSLLSATPTPSKSGCTSPSLCNSKGHNQCSKITITFGPLFISCSKYGPLFESPLQFQQEICRATPPGTSVLVSILFSTSQHLTLPPSTLCHRSTRHPADLVTALSPASHPSQLSKSQTAYHLFLHSRIHPHTSS